MKKDSIDKAFQKLQSEFDMAHPNLGHQERFLAKLKIQQQQPGKRVPSRQTFWKPFLNIAAAAIICLGIVSLLRPNEKTKDLASVSPEMAKTENFFTTTISEELLKLNEARTPDTNPLIDDAMQQMEILEKEYQALKIDLTVSGKDKRVIFAMISNFQTRIDLLKKVMETLENVKQLKQQNHENQITI